MNPQSAPGKWLFPMDCPDCKASSAYPYEAATIRGNTTTVRLGLRCRSCKHEWKLDVDTDAVPQPARDPAATADRRRL